MSATVDVTPELAVTRLTGPAGDRRRFEVCVHGVDGGGAVAELDAGDVVRLVGVLVELVAGAR